MRRRRPTAHEPAVRAEGPNDAPGGGRDGTGETRLGRRGRSAAPVLAALWTVASLAIGSEAAGQSLRDPFQRSFRGVVNNEGEITSGAAWADYDGDGDLDLFVSAFLNIDNFLYENLGEDGFRRVTEGLPVSDAGLSSGAAWADIDNDGRPDLFVANQQGQDNLLYRNLGGRSFERVEGPVHRDRGDSYAGAWADFDGDGWLDLFVANRSGEADFLYRNLGDGRFERVREGPVVEGRGNSMTGSWADYDGDGRPDLFVPSLDAETPSSLYRNLGDGRFRRVTGGPIGVDAAVSRKAAWGDYDNDGDLDLFVANGGAFSGSEQTPFLYRNDDGILVRVRDAEPVRHPFSGSDVAWFDMDDDGDLDLVAAAYREGNLVFRNDGADGFTRITAGWLADHGGFTDAIAVADYDRDGDLDLYLTHWEAQHDVLLTNGGNENHWLSLRLEGTRSNRSAIGATVTATASIRGREVTQLRQVGLGRAGRGQDHLAVHFGLGDAERARSVTVRWPSGEVTELGSLAADRFLAVREGEGVVGSRPAEAAEPVASPGSRMLAAFRSDGVEGALRVFRSLPERLTAAERARAIAGVARYAFDSVDREGGLALAAEALEEMPGQAPVVFAAAELRRAAGSHERARELYRRVLELLARGPGQPRVGPRTFDPFDRVWMERVSGRYTEGG